MLNAPPTPNRPPIRPPLTRLLLLAALLFPWTAACQVRPPIEVDYSFSTDPELARQRPADVALLPVQDATVARSLDEHDLEKPMWDALARGLVTRGYSPLGRAHVLAQLRSQNLDLTGDLTDPEVLRGATGRFGEDAALAVRIVRWDESKLRTSYRIGFRAEALLLSALGGRVLWSGSLEGNVKAGGAGPAPRAVDAARLSCAEEMMKELANYLPVRPVR